MNWQSPAIEWTWTVLVTAGALRHVLRMQRRYGTYLRAQAVGMDRATLRLAWARVRSETIRAIVKTIFIIPGIVALRTPDPPEVTPVGIAIALAFIVPALLLDLESYLDERDESAVE